MKLTQQLKSASVSSKGGEKESERLKKDLDKSRQVNVPGCSPDSVPPAATSANPSCMYFMQPVLTMLLGLHLSACCVSGSAGLTSLVNCAADLCLTACV